MTQSSNRLFDDLARLATDAMGAAQNVRREAETVMRGQLERLLQNMDLVSREEFEAVRQMAIAARDDNERLTERLAALEARLNAAPGTEPPAAAGPLGEPTV